MQYGGQAMKKHSVVHFEIYATEPDKVGQFYKNLFEWEIQQMPGMDYGWIKTVETDAKGAPTQTGGINGGILNRPKGYDGRAWVNYVKVESLEAALDRAKKLGATVMKE